MTDSLPILLARRQKRLKYWKDYFGVHTPPKDKLPELHALLSTYALLIAKLTKASETERAETEARIQGLERELTSIFEAARQETSFLNHPGGAPSLRS